MQDENDQLYKLNDLLTKQRDEARSQVNNHIEYRHYYMSRWLKEHRIEK